MQQFRLIFTFRDHKQLFATLALHSNLGTHRHDLIRNKQQSRILRPYCCVDRLEPGDRQVIFATFFYHRNDLLDDIIQLLLSTCLIGLEG